jgi:hypothetical protein
MARSKNKHYRPVSSLSTAEIESEAKAEEVSNPSQSGIAKYNLIYKYKSTRLA